MKKERAQVNFVKTEDGVRIDICCEKGRGQHSACCIPLCCKVVGGSGEATQKPGKGKMKRDAQR